MAASLTLKRLAKVATALSSSRSTERPLSARIRNSVGMSNSAANVFASISIGLTPAADSESRLKEPRSTCTVRSSSPRCRRMCASSWASVKRWRVGACSVLIPITGIPSRICAKPESVLSSGAYSTRILQDLTIRSIGTGAAVTLCSTRSACAALRASFLLGRLTTNYLLEDLPRTPRQSRFRPLTAAAGSGLNR